MTKQNTTIIIMCLFLLLYVPLSAQMHLPTYSADSAAIKYAETITIDDLQKHLTILASDEYQGRETGQKGQKMAAKYIADHFKSLKCPPIVNKDSYYQSFQLDNQKWDTASSITIKGKKYEFLKDFYTFAGVTEALSESVGKVLFLGYGIDDKKYSDYAGVNVKGKTILVYDGEPLDKHGNILITGNDEPSQWSTNWRIKLETAKAKGVKNMMVIVDDVPQRVNRFGQYILGGSQQIKGIQKENKYVNSIYISEEMAGSILKSRKLARFKRKISKRGKPKRKNAKTDVQIALTKTGDLTEVENVIGYIEGTDLKDEYVVVTAHYDHLGVSKDGKKIYNGADDDGSGTVTILEIAQAFAQAKAAGKGPRRSVVIMPVTGEEKGLLGSKYYTDMDPIFPLKQTVANLNVDMVGRVGNRYQGKTDSANYVYIIGSDKLSSELHTINEGMNRLYTKLTLDYKYNDENDPNRFYYRSDHYNFAKNNIPIIFYFNGTHDDYHQETDTVDKINFEVLQKRAQLVFHTAWQLANQDQRIEVDKSIK